MKTKNIKTSAIKAGLSFAMLSFFAPSVVLGSSHFVGDVEETLDSSNGKITCELGTTIASIEDNFTGMYGSTITNEGTITSIVGDFTYNYINKQVDDSNVYAGVVIKNYGTITSFEGNIIGNYGYNVNDSSIYVLGGAIYNSGSITFTASEGTSYSYVDNWAGADEDNASDENGGFMYMASSDATATFNTVATDSFITIGTGIANYDSIAGTGTINKTGSGTLTVNSSMQYYTGALNVKAGLMEVNNTLGASTITIDSGATLSMGITQNMVDSESIIFSYSGTTSIINSGTLNLIASSSLSADDSVLVGSYTLEEGSNDIVTYGGTITDGTFTVSALTTSTLENATSLDVSANGRVSITSDGSTELLSMAFSSSSETISLTVSSSSDFGAYITDESIVADISDAYTFSVDGLTTGTDSVVLSFVIADSSYSVSDFTIYYKSDEGDWGEATNVSDITYEDGTLSFIVDSFSSYGYSAIAVPEPSTYALIFGVLSLGFVAYRRKRK